MSKGSLKDKLDGNVLDLSLSSLTEIPVKELAALPKGTSVDLSCNTLTSIPDDFCKLTHIVRLDLSQNQITEIPHNIGSLNRLQHLDLYNNQLKTLPVGMCYLKSLKWLDLKGNPLDEPLHTVAGDCLDEIQCRNCAKKVVAFMKNAQSEQERRRQKQLQEEREQEALRKEEEERERERQREDKKVAKEQRRKEYEAQKVEEAGLRRRTNIPKEETVQQTAQDKDGKPKDGLKSEGKVEKKDGMSWGALFVGLLILLMLVCLGLWIHCDLHPNRQYCHDGRKALHKYSKLFLSNIRSF